MTLKTDLELKLLRAARYDIEKDVHCHICWSLSSMASASTSIQQIVWGLQREILEFLDGEISVRLWLDDECSPELVKVFQLAIIDTLISRRQR